jgi:LEA14-like dessication related protein
MDNKKILLGAAVLGIGYYLYKQYNNAKELGQSLILAPEGVDLDTTHISAPVIKFKIQINNPSPNTVTLEKVFATVKLNDSQIGTINLNDPIKINGTGSTDLSLNLTVNSLNLIAYLIHLNTTDLSNQNLSVEGYYVANSIYIPLKLNY